jgi:hypothetical protein
VQLKISQTQTLQPSSPKNPQQILHHTQINNNYQQISLEKKKKKKNASNKHISHLKIFFFFQSHRQNQELMRKLTNQNQGGALGLVMCEFFRISAAMVERSWETKASLLSSSSTLSASSSS